MSGYWRESDVSSADESESDTVVANHPEKDFVPWLRVTTAGPKSVVDTESKASGGDYGSRKTKSEWLSGSWPLRQFDETLPTTKRKAEWFRFRDQFERIVSCKSPVDAVTRLTGLKIFAGSYLLSIIEMQEKPIFELGGRWNGRRVQINHNSCGQILQRDVRQHQGAYQVSRVENEIG